MSAVLDWLKTNVFTVIFAVVMIAALVTLPLIASGLNEGVREEASRRAKKAGELKRLEQTQFVLPGPTRNSVPQTVLVNQKLLERYEVLARAVRDDAEAVAAEAVRHNQKGRGLLMRSLFPKPRAEDREVLPRRFYDLLQQTYRDLLDEIDAGSPVSAESLQEEIQRREAQFRTQMLAKEITDELTEEEQAQLTEVLANTRLSRCAEAAEQIGIYASAGAMGLPVWEQTRQPTLSELFEWQWQLWSYEDLLRALHGANRDHPSVVQSPVKRVLSLRFLPSQTAAGGSTPGPAGGMSLGVGGRKGGHRRGAAAVGGRASGSTAARGAKVDPGNEIPTDFARSYTGRTSNALYDVREVELRLVVETTRTPEVLDALSRQNFITISSLSMAPADSYQAVREGYFYGAEPVSKLELRLETIWLRAWTAQHMPDELKEALGIPVDKESAG